MTRRERMIRIIKYWDHTRQQEYYKAAMVARLGLDAYTDEAIELYARKLIEGHRRQQSHNREYRARIAARKAVPA